jgi:hypothetical protein
MEFRNKTANLNGQFQSVVQLLQKYFPQTSSDLQVRKSAESPDFIADQKIFQGIPKEAPITPKLAEEIAPSSEVATEPTPPGEAKVWKDANGRIHMGQSPPSDRESWKPEGSVSQGYKALAPKQNLNETTKPESSLIWRDEKGNVHMGSKAPEGADTKKAEDIKLTIAD